MYFRMSAQSGLTFEPREREHCLWASHRALIEQEYAERRAAASARACDRLKAISVPANKSTYASDDGGCKTGVVLQGQRGERNRSHLWRISV